MLKKRLFVSLIVVIEAFIKCIDQIKLVNVVQNGGLLLELVALLSCLTSVVIV